MIDLYKVIKRENITLHYVGADRIIAGDTMDVLINAYNTLSKYHGLSKKNISIRVIIASTKNDYDKILGGLIGLSGEVPTKKSEVARTHINDILLLSTFAYKQESTVEYTRENYYKILIDSMNKVFETFLSI